MKILVLSSFGEVCGIAAHTAELKQALIDAGHAVSVFPVDGPAQDRLARADLLGHFDGFVERIPAHDAVVIQHEYALYAGVHGYEASCEVFASLLARIARTGKPTLVTFHTDPPGTPKVPPLAPVGRFRRNHWQIIIATFNRSPHMAALVNSPAARRRMIESGMAAEKIAVLPLPIPVRPPHRGTPRPAEGVRLSIFGFVGRYKGYELALRSLLLLPRRYSLTIAGGEHPRDIEGTTLAAIREFLEAGDFPHGDLPPLPPASRAGVRAALAGRVTITGFLPDADIARILEETDVVLLPYMRYGPVQSAAAGWALACRRPIVATDVETFADVVAARPCMHLVPPDSPEALAAGITRVAEDGALRQSLMREAGLYAADNSWARAAAFVAGRLAALALLAPRPSLARSLFRIVRRPAAARKAEAQS